MPYTTSAKIEANIARVPFGATTKPTTTQITAMIADIAAEIETYLVGAGFAVPVTTPAEFLTWIGLVNQYGATAMVLKSCFPETAAAFPGSQDLGGGPILPAYAFWESRYQKALTMIRTGQISAPSADAGAGSMLARSYLTDFPDNDPNDDGSTAGQQPAFSMQREF